MLLSLALMLLCGMSLGKLFEKMRLPSLLGMLLTGMLLGPYVFNVLDGSILSISTEVRQIALIIILMRAGLSLKFNDLKQVGRPAILLCFVPACFEIVGVILLAPHLLNINILDAAILGTVIAAVSPAVVVPRMVKLLEEGYGINQGIPQMIMAGASMDDVFVIVLFTAFTGLAQSGTLNPSQFLVIPTSIALGIGGGILVGIALSVLFTFVHIRDSGKVFILLAISFLLVTIEQLTVGIISFSGFLAVMTVGMVLNQRKEEVAQRLSNKYSKMWVGAEVLLFVLVGAMVNIQYAIDAGMASLFLLIGVMLFRMIGIWVSLLKTRLSKKEKLFCLFAYMPKATVQAAIGGLPLAMGLSSGELILTVAVLSIILMAPTGALLIDRTSHKLLK